MASFIPIIHPWNQEVWQHLTNEPERSNHALLFTGPEGLGKVDLAMALAHFVMCDSHSQSESLFNSASHPDLHVLMPEIDVVNLGEDSVLAKFAQRYVEHHSGKPKKNIGIELIRKLSGAMTTHPHIAKHRIVLIANAESLNRNAANALLKNLEEPPQNTLFIIVSNEISRLPKTVRSRCSLIHFRTPELSAATAWLTQQKIMPDHEVVNHLAMANNQPLLAKAMFENGYIGSLKTVFTEVNGLWNRSKDPVSVAKNLHKLGSALALDILQKLTADLLKCSVCNNAETVFFPVQSSWVQSASKKLSQRKLLELVDEISNAKRLLTTTVDELLVLEVLGTKVAGLPS